jgi:hypothetical protein
MRSKYLANSTFLVTGTIFISKNSAVNNLGTTFLMNLPQVLLEKLTGFVFCSYPSIKGINFFVFVKLAKEIGPPFANLGDTVGGLVFLDFVIGCAFSIVLIIVDFKADLISASTT